MRFTAILAALALSLPVLSQETILIRRGGGGGGCADLTADADLVADWRFEESGSSVPRADETSFGNDLIATLMDDSAVIFVEGARSADNRDINGNLTLSDGSLSPSTFPGKAGGLTSDFSFGGWFRSTAGSAGVVMGKDLQWRVAVTAGPKWRCGIRDSTPTQFTADANINLTINQWYHVWCDWDGSTYRIYVDGVVQTDTESVTSLEHATSPMHFFVGAGSAHDGFVDASGVFQRSLSGPEIACIESDGIDGIGLP